MLDRANHGPAYRLISQFETEGPNPKRNTNLKRFWIIGFLLLVIMFFFANLYVYRVTSSYSTPERLVEFSGEDKLEEGLSRAREKYSQYLELANKTVSENNVSNVPTSTTNDEPYDLINAPTSNPLLRNVFAEMKDIKRTSTNIFFLETRCSTEKGLNEYLNNTGFILNARQCCSIESTALMNLDRPVYVFHSCPISEDFFRHSPKFVEKLFTYPNFFLVRLNASEVFNNTPLQELYEKRLLETSLYPIEHTSDLIRLLVLWRFGGTYSDIDVVTIRSFHALASNWAGCQDNVTIANGVVNFEPDGVGHDLLQQALEHVSKNYDGAQWSTNGPLLITPLILKVCHVDTVYESVQRCNGNFTVWPPGILYPIYYTAWEEFFNEDLGRQVVDKVKSGAFSVHIWNKMSQEAVARVNSTQAYALLASEFCQEVYYNCGDTF